MTQTHALYRILASKVDARKRCYARDNFEWYERHEDDIETLVHEHMPSGSGFDNGTGIDLCNSTDEKLVFNTAYHHMDEHGGYTQWTSHVVTVQASLIHGIVLTVRGRNLQGINEYIEWTFYDALTAVIDETNDDALRGA